MQLGVRLPVSGSPEHMTLAGETGKALHALTWPRLSQAQLEGLVRDTWVAGHKETSHLWTRPHLQGSNTFVWQRKAHVELAYGGLSTRQLALRQEPRDRVFRLIPAPPQAPAPHQFSKAQAPLSPNRGLVMTPSPMLLPQLSTSHTLTPNTV